MAYSPFLTLYETRIIATEAAMAPGSKSVRTAVQSGSRVIVTLSISSIDADTTVTVAVKHGFNDSEPFTSLGSVSGGSVSQTIEVFSDFNELLEFTYTVAGGNATFKVVVTMRDNSIVTVSGGGGSSDLTTRQKVLVADDTLEEITWADFGTANERATAVIYTSATYPDVTITKTLTYTLVDGIYRLDEIAWSDS